MKWHEVYFVFWGEKSPSNLTYSCRKNYPFAPCISLDEDDFSEIVRILEKEDRARFIFITNDIGETGKFALSSMTHGGEGVSLYADGMNSCLLVTIFGKQGTETTVLRPVDLALPSYISADKFYCIAIKTIFYFLQNELSSFLEAIDTIRFSTRCK